MTPHKKKYIKKSKTKLDNLETPEETSGHKEDYCEYLPNVKYAITINPSDKYQFIGYEDRVHRTQAYFLLRLRSILSEKDCHVVLIPELSKPTDCQSYPRIHWHGTIEFTTYGSVRFLLYGFRALSEYFNFCIKVIEDDEGWNKYLKKDKALFEPYWKLIECEYKITNKSEPTYLYLLNTKGRTKYNIKDTELLEKVPLKLDSDRSITRNNISKYCN